jgi:tryptophan-rich sensory protein
MSDLIALVASIAVCFAAAAIGSLATFRSLRGWYVRLAKPSWNPPNGVFGPVWTLLYVLMAVSVWLVWRARDDGDITVALVWFATQLWLNVLWSLVFFGLRSPIAGLVEIAVLWGSILGTIVAFAPHSLAAALLLVPYLAWVSFATVLNAAIVAANGGSARTAIRG